MDRKPGILTFMAILQLITPIGDVLLGSYFAHVDPMTYLSFLTRHEPWRFWFGHLFLQVVAAYAIYSVRMWSIPVFMGVCALNVLETALSWKNATGWFTFGVLIGAHIVNFGLISYFLLPAVREVFFNRRLRWWENHPRYRFDQEAVLFDASGNHKVQVVDVSIGGAFLRGARLPELAREMTLEFSYENVNIHVRGYIRHKGGKGQEHCGIEFFDVGAETKAALNNLAKALEFLGVERRPPRKDAVKEFKEWFVRFLFKGEGLFPDTAHAKAVIIGSRGSSSSSSDQTEKFKDSKADDKAA